MQNSLVWWKDFGPGTQYPDISSLSFTVLFFVSYSACVREIRLVAQEATLEGLGTRSTGLIRKRSMYDTIIY